LILTDNAHAELCFGEPGFVAARTRRTVSPGHDSRLTHAVPPRASLGWRAFPGCTKHREKRPRAELIAPRAKPAADRRSASVQQASRGCSPFALLHTSPRQVPKTLTFACVAASDKARLLLDHSGEIRS